MATVNFDDVFGNEYIATITGYRIGVELNPVTKKPLEFEIKPLGGQTKYFPVVMTMVCTLIVESPSQFYHEDFLTNSYTVTITRNGSTIFKGTTQKYNNTEPLKGAPYPFKILALEEKATWSKELYTDWQTSCSDLVSIPGVLGGTETNEFFDMDQIDTRKRWLGGKTKQEVAEFVASSFLATYGGTDDFEKLWVHNYLTYDASSRDLTENARNIPSISWDNALGKINVINNRSLDQLKIIDESETTVTATTYTYTSCEGFGILQDGINSGFQVAPQTEIQVSCKIINLTETITTNPAYDAALAGGTVTNTRQDDYTITLQVSVENTNDATVRYYNFDSGAWSSSSATLLTYTDDIQNNLISLIRDIQYYTFADFGSPGTFQPQFTVEIVVSGLSGNFEYSTDGGGSWLAGGTVDYSIDEIKTDLEYTLANIKAQYPINISSDTDHQVITYNTFFDNFDDLDLVSTTPGDYASTITDPIGSRVFAVTSDIASETDALSKYSKKTLEWIEAYLNGPITRITLDLECDLEIFTAPYKPFEFDYGLGNKLMKILRGKIDVKQNLFSGQIHEIITS